MDSIDLTFMGNNLNVFQKTGRVQNTALIFSLVMLAAWLICGFDSTPLQFIHVLYEGVPAFIQGQASLADLAAIYNQYYGKEMHYSAFVIYGLMFWYLSRHLQRCHGIEKSRNIAYSCSLTCFAIGLFEWFWIGSFAYWQRQPWVATWKWPQLRILTQNLVFVVVGIIGVLYMWSDSFILFEKQVLGRRYHFNWSWKAWLLITFTVGSGLLWWFYPWPVKQISVELATGETWTSSTRFPNTLYTIDVDPTDAFNAGVWFYVENDAVHGLNTLMKILLTASVLYVGLIRKVTSCEG